MFNKTKPFRFTELVKLIEREELEEFVAQEVTLFTKSSPTADKTLSQCIITNLAMFDLDTLNSELGIKHMHRLLGDNNTQTVNKRLKQLLHTLYIKYGMDQLNELSIHVLSSLVVVYDVSEDIIAELDSQYSYFWLIPLIRETYYRIMNPEL